MMGDTVTGPYDFATRLENGKLHLNCPGNAAGIDPGENSWEMNKGHNYGGHNMDAGWQLLTILTGLGELHNIARKGMA
jgi:hypothetical protein